MPQIWMTYAEIGALLNCPPMAAREVVIEIGLDRRRSRDGQTRVKLNARLTQVFFNAMVEAWVDGELKVCAGNLHAVHRRMAGRELRQIKGFLAAK